MDRDIEHTIKRWFDLILWPLIGWWDGKYSKYCQYMSIGSLGELVMDVIEMWCAEALTAEELRSRILDYIESHRVGEEFIRFRKMYEFFSMKSHYWIVCHDLTHTGAEAIRPLSDLPVLLLSVEYATTRMDTTCAMGPGVPLHLISRLNEWFRTLFRLLDNENMVFHETICSTILLTNHTFLSFWIIHSVL